MSKATRRRKSATARDTRPAPDCTEADRIIAEVEEAVSTGRGTISFPRKGRPSLTGRREVSPSVGFRIAPELRARAERVAVERGVTVSALAREALEEYLRKAG